MRIFNEVELLSEDFRKMVIEEIESPENIARKESMKKRYEVYKDNTKKYVLEMMEAESADKQIAKEISHRISNISFTKKIIDKKAMVYKDGVLRESLDGKKATQNQIDKQSDLVNINSTMKKTNKYAELFRNALVSVLPYKCFQTDRYYYKPNVLMPFLYDVIEDFENPELARAIITSYYTKSTPAAYADEGMSAHREDVGDKSAPTSFRSGDGVDQQIADSPNDDGINKKEYIWWSTNYHFTTDNKGKIIPGKQEEDLLNPIQQLPFYNFSKDQDGHYWAIGGEDIIDGAILLNMLLADLFYIAKYQGMGIGYMFGKGVPKNAKVGASSFVTMEVEEGDPTPQLGFATSNPPIQAHLEMIEAYVAYLLSTNKLEVSSVQAKLSATTAASGVHEMVKRAENVDDIQEQRETYRDGEPVIYQLMMKWHNLYLGRDQLKDEYAELGVINEDLRVKVRFSDPQPFITEKEKLEIIQTRMDIGLDSIKDAIKRDNPDLTGPEVEEKLRLLLEEKLKDSNNKLKLFGKENEEEREEEEEVENGK